MRAFLVAGEPSGDRLGAALMAGLKTLAPGIAFDGVGGPAMAAQGLVSRFDFSELSVMGIAEVLPRYPRLLARMKATARAAIDTAPDVLITIDSPDFGLRVAARVRAAGAPVRIVHYVAPSVWAWRPGRARKMARAVDQVLCLLPFEPPHMEAAGMRADFVGHPVVAEPRATDAETRAFRDTHALGDAPVILALPGSRHGEVTRLAPVFGAALRSVLASRPGARVVVVAAAPVAEAVAGLARAWPGAPLILRSDDPAKGAAFAAADVALAASGTVSLELARAETPMVVAYDMNWLTWQIVARAVRLDTVTLVNLVSETRAVPEFLGPACRPAPIAGALLDTLDAPETQLAAMRRTMERLGQGGEAPGLRAARAVLDGLGASSG